MWECPGLFELDGKWVLTFSPMFCGERKAVYWVGDMDFEAGRYERASDGELDWSFDYYAAQSMRCPGGRTVLITWMNGWDWMPWWRDFSPTAPEGWCGCMALPRSISLDGQGKLRLWPGAEVEVLYDQQETQTDLTVGHAPVPLACPDSVCFALELVIDEGHGDAQKLHVVLQASQGKRTDYARCTLTFDRSDADDGCSQGIRCQKIQDARKLLIYSDTSSIELFADGGEVCMSFTIYPTHGEQGLMLTSEGGVSRIVSAKLPSIKPAGGSAHGL